ncbi:hypothetical protein [Gemmatimonas sp.]|jgi:hypothetical protein|uniref:hypothetical protein n=1 Tax=Gemmatimonas sp. TaxID=1962908 RepID=UPI0037BEC6BE
MDLLPVLDRVIFDWGNIVWAVGLLWWAQVQPGHTPLRRLGRWGAALFLLYWLDARLLPGESPASYVLRVFLLVARVTCVIGLVSSLSLLSRHRSTDAA